MRIDRLMVNFGMHQNREFDLSAGVQGLHLIHGPNESGKTTTLRAIHQFFNEIETRTTDNYLIKNEELRIGARLRPIDGPPVDLIRRKGTKNTLLKSDGLTAADPDILARLLGGMSPSDFVTRFVLDHDRMKAGGLDIVKGGGHLGEMLFSAGTGIGGFRKIRDELETQAADLFKKGGSKPRINEKQAMLDGLSKARRESELKGSVWSGLKDQHALAISENARLLEVIAEAKRARARLGRVRDAIEPARERARLLEELGPLADAPLLPADFRERRLGQLASFRNFQEREHALQAKIERLTRDLDALNIPENLLNQGPAIDDLYARLKGYDKAKRDTISQAAAIELIESQIRSALLDLGRDASDLTDDVLEGVRLKTADRALVRGLSNQRSLLDAERKRTREAIETWEKRVNIARDKLRTFGEARDAEALKKALKAARKHVHLEAEIQNGRKDQQKDQAKALKLLKQLNGWSGTVEDAEALVLPPAETIERFRTTLEQAEAKLIEVTQKIQDARNETLRIAAEVETLASFGEVPTESALLDARLLRDQHWTSLKNQWNPELSETFERSMRDSDELVDRLRRESERVAKHGQLLAEQNRNKATLELLQADKNLAETRRTEHAALWKSLWTPMGIEPQSPSEMSGWSRKHSELAVIATAISERQKSVEEREALVLNHRRNMEAVLANAGESYDGDESLAELIDRAEACETAIDKETKSRDKAQESLESLETDGPALKEAELKANNAWNDWQNRWREAMDRIGLADDVENTIAESVLSRSEELVAMAEKLRVHRLELAASNDEIARFEVDLRNLSRKLPEEAIDESPAAVISLYQRLGKAKTDREAFAGFVKQRNEAEAELEEVGISLKSNANLLEHLRKEASCGPNDDLEAIEARAEKRRSLETAVAEKVRELRRLAVADSLDVFLDEINAADPIDLESRIAQLDESIDQSERERDANQHKIGEMTAELKRWDGDARAALAVQNADVLRAEMRGDVEDYIRLRLASALLREAMERYREKSQGPVVKRAGELFSKLTLGAYQGLTVDFDDKDNPVLRAVRREGEPTLGDDKLSLGTADQLYLALRLATLETNLNGKEPLPLVVDDILNQWDNERVAAAFEILGKLSNRTQIVMFTHHEHLVEIAREKLSSKVLFTHQLERIWRK